MFPSSLRQQANIYYSNWFDACYGVAVCRFTLIFPSQQMSNPPAIQLIFLVGLMHTPMILDQYSQVRTQQCHGSDKYDTTKFCKCVYETLICVNECLLRLNEDKLNACHKLTALTFVNESINLFACACVVYIAIICSIAIRESLFLLEQSRRWGASNVTLCQIFMTIHNCFQFSVCLCIYFG